MGKGELGIKINLNDTVEYLWYVTERKRKNKWLETIKIESLITRKESNWIVKQHQTDF